MKSFEECGIDSQAVTEIEASVRRRIAGKYVQDFYCGLLRLALTGPGKGFTRAEIAAVIDPERTEFADNYWAKEDQIFVQLEMHRAYLSRGLNGRLLAIQRDQKRPYRYQFGVSEPEDGGAPFLLDGSILRYREDHKPPRLSLVGRLTHPGVGQRREDCRKWLFLALSFLVARSSLSFAYFCQCWHSCRLACAHCRWEHTGYSRQSPASCGGLYHAAGSVFSMIASCCWAWQMYPVPRQA